LKTSHFLIKNSQNLTYFNNKIKVIAILTNGLLRTCSQSINQNNYQIFMIFLDKLKMKRKKQYILQEKVVFGSKTKTANQMILKTDNNNLKIKNNKN
jgi:hypothetical protein